MGVDLFGMLQRRMPQADGLPVKFGFAGPFVFKGNLFWTFGGLAAGRVLDPLDFLQGRKYLNGRRSRFRDNAQ